MDNPFSVTSREIASSAHVQPAMINYCFGSRENLIYATFFKRYLSFLEDKEISKIISSGEPPKALLKQLHLAVASCLIENYNFTKAITGYILFKRDLSQEAFSLHLVRDHYQGRKTEEECKEEAKAIIEFAKSYGYPNLKDGGEVRNTSGISTSQQFADWMKKNTK